MSDADTDIRYDGAMINVLTKMGTARDKSEWTAPGAGTYFAKRQLEELYKSSIFQRICGARPESAIEKGWELTLGKADPVIIDGFREYSDRLDVPAAFCQAQIWANLYRGAAIVIICDDGQPWSEPIDEKRIKTIKSLEVLDCNKIRPILDDEWNALNPTYYQLILPYEMDKKFREFNKNVDLYRIHCSRVIRFDGVIYPNDEMLRLNGWGGSVIESVWEDYAGWRTGLKAMSAMLADFSIFIYKMKGLSKLIRSNQAELLQSHFSVLQMMISVFGGIALDAEGEDAQFLTRQFGGADAISKELRDAFIGATGIPHDKLFGESPSGLGATGESEAKNWAADIASFQKTRWYKKLRSLYRLVFLAADGPTKQKEPEGWKIKFLPILQESQQDVAATRSTQSQTDNTYISAGVLLPEEVRKARFGSAEYSLETTLDEKLWEQNKQQQQEQSYSGFDEFAEEPAPAETPVEDAPAELSPGQQAFAEAQQDSSDRLDARFDSVRSVVEAEARSRFQIVPSIWANLWIEKEVRSRLGSRMDSAEWERERARFTNLLC